MADAPTNLDEDGLPRNAVELVAQAMCCGTTRGCSALRDGGTCLADGLRGKDALQAVSGLRACIRRARRQAARPS
ncbi:hypothetical protein FHP25_24855 [Vineibacter terrae]|uniref:Uncharacterized protein n=1 Tax=Vineibacter terrae TaxID=2586908 RepID=A0A5C8PFE8_9HYPH|nr:hypothetical protein [Vineibacter terrae]TXL72528.1 hypothetical protein FHP25_24855 [Vineibacter terrae]